MDKRGVLGLLLPRWCQPPARASTTLLGTRNTDTAVCTNVSETSAHKTRKHVRKTQGDGDSQDPSPVDAALEISKGSRALLERHSIEDGS